MRVIDELTRCSAIVKQNVETSEIELGFDCRADFLQGLAKCSENIYRNFRVGRIVGLGNYQCVPLANRIDVQEC